VTPAGGAAATILKSAPFEFSQKNILVAAGDTFLVDCYVIQQDGQWYRLRDNRGWLRDDELLPAPYTGLKSPPQCPA
jgi:hypothetical protein